MKVLLAHPGTQYSYRLAAELHRHDALQGFYTGVIFPSGGWMDRAMPLIPSKWRRRLKNRRIEGVPASRLHRRPFTELSALWRLRAGDDAQAVWHRRAEVFQQSIPDRALAEATAVIGFDTASWNLAERCRSLGVPFILDQSIGHPDAKLPVYRQIAEQYPEWTDGIEPRRPEVRAAEQQEHDAAVRIAAASSFTRRTLIKHGAEAAKIRVNPYGVDVGQFNAKWRGDSGRLRFLFVGLVDARKGVPLLCDAWRKLHGAGAELWLVGSASQQTMSRLPDLPGLKFFERVPHAEIPALMQQCDVFVFPSCFEGFGLVLLEAMASGLPVITTTATAGPDIITEGEDGWVIEPGDLERLTERMAYCIEHPAMVREMGRSARATAEGFTWHAYGDRWMQILSELRGAEAREGLCGQNRLAASAVQCNPAPSAAK